jgi:hypothetical protein
LKDLTKKLSKLTHKQAPPGTANTQNVSTVQNIGIHESYAQRLMILSRQIQQVRHDHLSEYTKAQLDVDRFIARAFARCSRQNYQALADALLKTGSAEAIGGVNAWGVFANKGMAAPIVDLEAEENAEDQEIDDDWEPSLDEGAEGMMSPRQMALSQGPRPPSSMADHMPLASLGAVHRYPQVTVAMQGKFPQQGYDPYPGSSAPHPFQPNVASVYPTQPQVIHSI